MADRLVEPQRGIRSVELTEIHDVGALVDLYERYPDVETVTLYRQPLAVLVRHAMGTSKDTQAPSLRDTFAAAALSRIPPGVTDANAATQAYSLADAMLKAREAK